MLEANTSAPSAPVAVGHSSEEPRRSALLTAAATLWWSLWHMPVCALNYYGVLAAKRFWFALALRPDRERRAVSASARRLIDDYRRDEICVFEGYLAPAAMEHLEGLLRESGCRQAVAERKAQAARGPDANFFHLSQEPLAPELNRQILQEVFPPDFLPAFELARGCTLRCYSVTYHETEPSDPLTRVGDSVYNGHPFHCDGSPKFAKGLLYLSDVGESSGPFEMIPHSRFGFFDELARLAYQPKRARRSRVARWLRPHRG